MNTRKSRRYGKKEKGREIKANEMDVAVRLWYLSAGGNPKDEKVALNNGKFLFFDTTKTVTIK